MSVSDGNGGSDSITVTINVTDVNENSAPVFTDGTSTTRSIAEDTAAAQNIGTPVAATDADSGDSLTYTLGGTDAASFAIVSTSGQLQTKATLDFETKSSYEVTVSVSDGNGGSDSITVTINVTDVTETTITLVKDRTPFVRDKIVAAVSDVNRAEDVTTTHLAAIRSLDLSGYWTDESLDADWIGLESLKSGDFDGLTNLRTLVINYGDFESLPAGLFDDLTSLKTLRLNDGYLSTFPAGIFDKLTSLKTLAMNSQAFATLPAGLFDKLTSLTTLRLNDGIFQTLSASIFDKLTSLKTLDLSDGYFSTLPAGLFDKLTSLKTLELQDGFIESLPAGLFDKLTSLTLLDLRDNLLDIPAMQNAGYFDNLTHVTIKTKGNEPGAPAAAVTDVSRSTTLLPNYPNPFNPETWIPYQLAAPAKVTVTIYNVHGVVVRKLDLGLKLEGKYISRSRAAYWDGRNNVGEQVATGLYFYTLTAGNFTATRKMLIRK